ncbi:hypothetical protein XcvCFBP7113P_22315 [Xanthomonas citri pv. vignicola]|nr:hypothetical protein XcvCFBP7113P_22315 [Xanthomonas citri pv. vignicola]
MRRSSPSPPGARRHGLRATGARALERPHRRRGPGRGAGSGEGMGRSHRNYSECTRLRTHPHPPYGHLLPVGEGSLAAAFIGVESSAGLGGYSTLMVWVRVWLAPGASSMTSGPALAASRQT